MRQEVELITQEELEEENRVLRTVLRGRREIRADVDEEGDLE